MLSKSKIIVFAVFINSFAFAQNEMSLKQCVEFGIQNNLSLQKSSLEVDKNKQKEREVLSSALPQINGSAVLNDNLNLATQLIPGEIVGKPGTMIPVRFGTQYNLTVGVSASQMIYNQTFILATRASKVAEDLAVLGVEKAKEQLVYDISSAYYALQVTGVQKNIVESNLIKMQRMMELTKLQYENGLAKKSDYDRLQVNVSNLQSEFDNINQTLLYQSSLLKFFMGMKLDSNITISNLIEPSKMQLSVNNNNLANNVDLKIIETQKELNELNIKQYYAGYIPSLNANAVYNWQNMGNQIQWTGNDAKWYNITMVGVTLSVPIFDGFNKQSKASQAKIQQEQLNLDALYLAESIRLQNLNAFNRLKANENSVLTQEKNMKLAEEIYVSTQEQFKNGLVSLSELINAETSLKESQNNYLRALVQVKLAELDLLKASGDIESIIK